MPGSCCHFAWECKGKLNQNTCWRSWWPECGRNWSFTSLSYSVRTGHWVPLSQPTPCPATPLAVARNCWQLIEFLGVDCVQLWVAQYILKQTWKEQWSRTHRLTVCAAVRCCSVQHSIISELWTGCYLLWVFMRSRKADEVIIPNGVNGVCLLWNVWAFRVCSIRSSGSSKLFEGRISCKS